MSQTQSTLTCPDRRFRVRIKTGVPRPASIEINDLWRHRRFAKWQGQIVDRILLSKCIPSAHRRGGAFLCDKAVVQDLMLAAAASCLPAITTESSLVEFNRRRLRLDRDGRSALHDRVLDLLFSYPGHHFSEQDVFCVMSLRFPYASTQRVSRCLRDIVNWRLVQRIDVDENNVFFDTNTTAHLHVFDAKRRLLLDAPQSGVVTAELS